ncbi:MAG: ATP-binding protein, partial [Cyanobacteria bacterium J06639_1]
FPLPDRCMGVAFDNITDRKRSERLLLAQKQILEAIATGNELDDVLRAVVDAIESQVPESMGSLLLYEAESHTLRRKMTPNVPDEFARALDGLPVGAAGGACGMAVYELKPVIVEDFATDPLCRDFVEMASRNGIRACWSYPIISRDRRALGSLAVYSPAPRSPDPHHLQLLSALTQLAAIALDRQQSERELARSERLYRTVVNRVQEVIFRTDRYGNLTFLNPAWQEIVGYPIDTSLNRPIWELVYESDRSACRAAFEAIAGGELDEVQIEFRVMKPDNSFCWLEMDIQASRSGSDRFIGTLGTLFDVTERKQSEATLQARADELVSINTMLLQTTSLLEQRNRELDQFAYVTSHDLKAPLRAIANLSQWLEEDLDEYLDDDTRHQMDLMRGRVQRMEGLINGLLQYSRAGRTAAPVETVETNELLHEIIDLVAPASEFRFELPERPLTLQVERLPLQQVLSNLITNAIKHHDRTDGCVRIEARDRGDGFYEFRVGDDGPGIAPDYFEKIFTIFQTLTARDKAENTGIGLSIVKKLVESKGGAIAVSSELGRGATFTFTWPHQPAEKDADRGLLPEPLPGGRGIGGVNSATNISVEDCRSYGRV